MDGLDEAIAYFGGLGNGGLVKLARAIGATQSQVSMWRVRGRVPIQPTPWPVRIQQATGGVVPASRIRPEVYSEPSKVA